MIWTVPFILVYTVKEFGKIHNLDCYLCYRRLLDEAEEESVAQGLEAPGPARWDFLSRIQSYRMVDILVVCPCVRLIHLFTDQLLDPSADLHE